MKHLEDTIDYYKTLNREVKQIRKLLIIAFIKDLFKNKKLMMCKYLLIGSLTFIGGKLAIDVINHNAALQSLIDVYAHRKIPKQDTLYLHDSTRNEKAFLAQLARLESGGKYTIVNKYGYMGKYQFGRAALTAIGLGGVTQEDFLETPELQEVAMQLLLRKNKKNLAPLIGKHQHRTIKGVFVTESGILAGAHLVGGGGVTQFLESNGAIDPVDGNNTPVSKYLKVLSGYNLEF